MAIKRSKAPPGTLVTLEHSSRVLRDYPWGDPHVRKVAVWLPPQYTILKVPPGADTR